METSYCIHMDNVRLILASINHWTQTAGKWQLWQQQVSGYWQTIISVTIPEV